MRICRLPLWLLVIALASYGCRSSPNPVGPGNTDEMKRIQGAFEDLQKGLGTDESNQAFTQRVNDTLAKIGDLEKSEGIADVGLPERTDKVSIVYGYFGQAALAYSMSQRYLGNRWDEQSQTVTDSTSNAEQQSVNAAFPGIYVVDTMSRRKTVSDLLLVAQGETRDAGELIKTL
jgi:hypothetical protein